MLRTGVDVVVGGLRIGVDLRRPASTSTEEAMTCTEIPEAMMRSKASTPSDGRMPSRTAASTVDSIPAGSAIGEPVRRSEVRAIAPLTRRIVNPSTKATSSPRSSQIAMSNTARASAVAERRRTWLTAVAGQADTATQRSREDRAIEHLVGHEAMVASPLGTSGSADAATVIQLGLDSAA